MTLKLLQSRNDSSKPVERAQTLYMKSRESLIDDLCEKGLAMMNVNFTLALQCWCVMLRSFWAPGTPLPLFIPQQISRIHLLLLSQHLKLLAEGCRYKHALASIFPIVSSTSGIEASGLTHWSKSIQVNFPESLQQALNSDLQQLGPYNSCLDDDVFVWWCRWHLCRA